MLQLPTVTFYSEERLAGPCGSRQDGHKLRNPLTRRGGDGEKLAEARVKGSAGLSLEDLALLHEAVPGIEHAR